MNELEQKWASIRSKKFPESGKKGEGVRGQMLKIITVILEVHRFKYLLWGVRTAEGGCSANGEGGVVLTGFFINSCGGGGGIM